MNTRTLKIALVAAAVIIGGYTMATSTTLPQFIMAAVLAILLVVLAVLSCIALQWHVEQVAQLHVHEYDQQFPSLVEWSDEKKRVDLYV